MAFPLKRNSGSQLGMIWAPGDAQLCPETILFGWRPELLLHVLRAAPRPAPYNKALSGQNVNSAEIEKPAIQDSARVNIQHPLNIQMSILPFKGRTLPWNPVLEKSELQSVESGMTF